ncbi:MAG: DUF1015 family protein, partial [Acidobacteriota bacterium]|nr:DUF1015 family protein [Acidobacteriota bacterium]
VDEGWLVQDPRPAYYIYQLVMDGQSQTGIVGAAAVTDYLAGKIKKHEFTRPDKEEDRIRLNDALDAHPGPVFLTYQPLPELNALINGVVARDPDVDFVAVDGVQHTLWRVDDTQQVNDIARLLGSVRATYVADGHHRTAAAAAVSKMRGELLEDATGEEPCHYFMAVHFPVDQVRVLDYNRVVRDLNGLDSEQLLERISAAGFQVEPGHAGKRPPHAETFGMYLGGQWYLLRPRTEIIPEGDVVGQLDVAILTDRLLQPILGIGDPRTDRRIDFVGGIRGMQELERRVDSGRDAVAFAIYPTRLEQVMKVADAGRVMPPKSTWFEPKLRSGMVVQRIDGDRL